MEVAPILTFRICLGGYPTGNLSNGNCQTTPKPIGSLAIKTQQKPGQLPYIVKKVAAGSRHTLLLMIHCRKAPNKYSDEYRRKKVMLTGLNQALLCEEPGNLEPVEIGLDRDTAPIDVVAGHGVSFIVDRVGNVYSFGLGNHGVLGHGDDLTNQIPRQIMGLFKVKIKQVSVGEFHALAVTYPGKVWSWGRNHRGQLGRGYESNQIEPNPSVVMEFNDPKYRVLEIACGELHNIAMVEVSKKEGKELNTVIFGWGDDSRMQLSSCDHSTRSTPKEMRWVSKFLAKLQVSPQKIAAGGGHNLVLTSGIGQVVSWGAGEYGQLGHGDSWDTAHPRAIKDMSGAISVHAGKRHSAAIVRKPQVENEARIKAKQERILKAQAAAAELAAKQAAEDEALLNPNNAVSTMARPTISTQSPQLGSKSSISPSKISVSSPRKSKKKKALPVVDVVDNESPREHMDVFTWGYNAYGELGLGDTNIRLFPCRVTALQNARVRSMSLGDRHTVVITDHIPMLAREIPQLKMFYEVLKVS